MSFGSGLEGDSEDPERDNKLNSMVQTPQTSQVVRAAKDLSVILRFTFWQLHNT